MCRNVLNILEHHRSGRYHFHCNVVFSCRQWLASVVLASVLPSSSVSWPLLVVPCSGRTALMEVKAVLPLSYQVCPLVPQLSHLRNKLAIFCSVFLYHGVRL